MADKTERKTYATAFSFDVSFKGNIEVKDMGWQEVSGLSRELGVEEVSVQVHDTMYPLIYARDRG